MTITGNNARVRGIHVMGNVIIELNTAAFLLSPLSSGITGQTLYVDAGYSIMGI